MKTRFNSNSSVCHAFAQQIQTEGSANSIFFKCSKYDMNYADVIYSYGHHYELARFINDNTILINDSGYSVSTSKHIGIITSATRQYKQYFTMDCDLNLVYNQIITAKDKLAKARKPEMYISKILNLWESLTEYTNLFAKGNKKNTKYKEIAKIVKALESSPTDYKDKISKLAKAKAAKDKRDNAKKVKEALIKFNNYEINSFRYGNEDYLRISENGQYVESSQSVKVEIPEAKLLAKMIENKRDIKGHKIGYYTVISINGTLKIGCHNINMKSVQNIITELKNLN